MGSVSCSSCSAAADAVAAVAIASAATPYELCCCCFLSSSSLPPTHAANSVSEADFNASVDYAGIIMISTRTYTRVRWMAATADVSVHTEYRRRIPVQMPSVHTQSSPSLLCDPLNLGINLTMVRRRVLALDHPGLPYLPRGIPRSVPSTRTRISNAWTPTGNRGYPIGRSGAAARDEPAKTRLVSILVEAWLLGVALRGHPEGSPREKEGGFDPCLVLRWTTAARLALRYAGPDMLSVRSNPDSHACVASGISMVRLRDSPSARPESPLRNMDRL